MASKMNFKKLKVLVVARQIIAVAILLLNCSQAVFRTHSIYNGTSQGGSVKESLDKDLFYTFSDDEIGDHAAKKDEAVHYKEGIEDGKKGQKKVKRVRPWVPFVCYSAKSPSANKKTYHAAKKEAVDDKEGIKDGNKGRKK
ncbi:hypothetical protein Tco_0444686 [Tanacetum coccineum]